MSESLNVIALISGGKDSFYSLIHCVQNGHKVVALGNLHPRLLSPKNQSAGNKTSENQDVETGEQSHGDQEKSVDVSNTANADNAAIENEERDLNSFMYQTVGHTVIPLYEKALGIPLYRQEILGTAVETGTSYRQPSSSESSTLNIHDEDETESLVPLLRRIMAAHPEANAISTGAILSTYQRTRVESVALRLGLVPLSFLWQYPVLPPGTQISLLQDMSSASLDARIIKVASGGLDEEYLWENIASVRGMTRVERAMKRFGNDGDGSVIGEGGEFETLVVDGPDWLFRGRIEIDEGDRRIVREGGGAAWLAMEKARVVMKEEKPAERSELRVPTLLDEQFERCLGEIGEASLKTEKSSVEEDIHVPMEIHEALNAKAKLGPDSKPIGVASWTIASSPSEKVQTVEEEMASHMQKIEELLATNNRPASDITFAFIMLRSMNDFAIINKVYGSLFTEPNPPARVTIANGDVLSDGQHVTLHLTLRGQHYPAEAKKALHVQSRSYWAPANIGPYSQAISVPQKTSSSSTTHNSVVHVAGQIPLVPRTMTLPDASPNKFELQTILSLQHLWRIGIEMNISWWTSAVAFLPRDTATNLSHKAQIAGRAWDAQFRAVDDGDDEEEERDLWEEKHRGGFGRSAESTKKNLPNWEAVGSTNAVPPFFAAEVEMLPRGSGIEWYAHLGVVGAGINVSEEQLGTTLKHTCCGGDSFSQSVLLVSHTSAHDTHKKMERIRNESSWHEAKFVEIYADANLWVPEDNRTVIPCRSLWDKSGKRLAAVFITRNSI